MNPLPDRLAMQQQIGAQLGIADPIVLRDLVLGMEDATGYQEQTSGITDPGLSMKEMAQALRSMQGALRRISRGTITQAALAQLRNAAKMIPPEYLAVLEQYGGEIMDIDRLLVELEQSPSEATTHRLLSSVEGFLEDLAKPGRGGARRQAMRYAMGIKKLAEWFTEALPKNAVSAAPSSVFYAYASIWLREYQGFDGDPERHIGNALTLRASWKNFPSNVP